MKASHLRIATYNLQKCVGLDLRRRPDRTLNVLGATGAQVAVLQEVDKRLPPRPAALPHDMVESEGWQILPFGAPGGSLGWHGNAMLVRGGVRATRTLHLDLPGLEPRGAILADLDTPLGALRVVGLHLGLVRRYRLLQVATVIRVLGRLPALPTVLAGDFNDWGDGAAIEATAHDMRFAATPPSFPAPRPVARLDRFALSPGLLARATAAYRARPARVASDHLPVWIDLG
ncbi:endonuclease/exonuclease/phosphatase family protein [Roseovarius sp. SYSU LYC5161]|uniref:endonuclease/exonuclease/phosphatase family protein n=1 Tax=Roseovarius halophilus (ex Wu et al. 2025) TaxID=3376060 RepID=UPI00399978C3